MKREAARRRLEAMDALTKANVPYVTNNVGVHLMIGTNNNRVDFWPGSGLWKDRQNLSGYGLPSLFLRLNLDLPQTLDRASAGLGGGGGGGTG